MKLRIHGNSLRLRLNQSEVAQFSKTGWLEEAIEFAHGASLAYGLESLSSLASPRAVYQNGTLRIQVPSGTANEWITTERVGISGDQALSRWKAALDPGRKRFQVHPQRDPDPEAYPNPEAEETATKME